MSGDNNNEPMEVEEQFTLPPKDKCSSYQGVCENTVLANLFAIDIDPDQTIYKYRIDMTKVIASKNKESDITKGPNNDPARQLRRRVTLSLMNDLFKFAAKDGRPLVDDKAKFIYDCGNLIYSSEEFECFKEFKGDEKKEQAYRMGLESVGSENTKKFLGASCSELLFIIVPVLTFNPTLKGEMCLRRETQQFLEVVTSARIAKEGDHFIFQNKIYPKSSKKDVSLGEGKSIKPGFEKNVRVGERDGRPCALLQLDAKKSPFFDGQKLIDFCLEFLRLRNVEDLEQLSSSQSRQLNAQLKGLVVRTTHNSKNKQRMFVISQVSNQRVKDVTFERAGQPVRLDDYFRSQYNVPIKYTRTPVIVERKAQGSSFYPMEFLEIERGQRVNCQKATPSMGEKQIQECRMSPLDMKTFVEDALYECGVDKHNDYLKTFKITIERHWERANATVLHPPRINYKNSSVECSRDGFMNWRLGREIFTRGGKIDNFYFINFDECVYDDQIGHFCDTLLKNARQFGVEVDPRNFTVKYMRSESDDKIEELFRDVKSKKNPYVFAVTAQKLDPVHDTLKVMEAKYGVITQHVWKTTFQKAIGPKGAFMVISNLVLKLNLKSHGINHTLDISRTFKDFNRNAGEIDKRVFAKYRMLVGLDVSHAGPQSYADRQAGTRSSEPSVVGMSYSISSPTEMKGTYWLQEARLATITDLGAKMVDALNHYNTAMGRYPEEIIIYRGGVSEGEYAKVVQEVTDMKQSFTKFPGFEPSLMTIIVQTNSNFRVIPERIDPRAKPMDQNVRPGCCVDTGIVNPQYNEFILVGQKGIMGTVRPIRCVVAMLEQGRTGKVLNAEDVKILTHSLCYGHQVVAGSTTLPCLLTAATNLSKRGRNNWKTINFRDADMRSELSAGSGGAFRHDGSDNFFADISRTVGTNLTHHFWA